jgi:hypothetical protein
MDRFTQQEIFEQLKASFNARIPSGMTIAERAVSRALAGRNADPKWIKKHFSVLVAKVQSDAYRVYLDAEKSAAREAFDRTFLPLLNGTAEPRDIVNLLGDNFFSLDKFFLSLTQGRRQRAGGAFELLIRRLFLRLGYPFTLRPIINGQPDFVLPSIEHFEAHAMDAIIFTVKRSLRERWRQIVTEGTRGLGFFLATIDEKVAKRDLKEMRTSRISLVVPESVKTCRSDYEEAANVLTFEDFFKFHLDPAMKRWRARKVI